MISLWPVLVSTLQARGCIIAPSRSHDVLALSASRPSSTAANATSPPLTGTPSCVTRMRAVAVWRTEYCGLSVVTSTFSSCSARPTLNAATPSLNAGLERSTIAVGASYSRPSYQ